MINWRLVSLLMQDSGSNVAALVSLQPNLSSAPTPALLDPGCAHREKQNSIHLSFRCFNRLTGSQQLHSISEHYTVTSTTFRLTISFTILMHLPLAHLHLNWRFYPDRCRTRPSRSHGWGWSRLKVYYLMDPDHLLRKTDRRGHSEWDNNLQTFDFIKCQT